MPDVRIYVEGDPREKAPQGGLKEALGVFFEDLESALPDDWRIVIVPGCGWPQTFSMFEEGVKDYKDDFVVLLIDSEAPFTGELSEREHFSSLRGRNVSGFNDDQCFLLIQAIEAWLIADIDSLEQFCGTGFRRERIKHPKGIESLSPATLRIQIQTACRESEWGKYTKGRTYELLRIIRSEVVREVMTSCQRIFEVIPKAVAQL